MNDIESLQERVLDLRSKGVFFVVGVAKSGTTWLQKMLDGHPDVSCNGEGHFTDVLLPILTDAVARYNQNIHGRNGRMYKDGGGYPTLSDEHAQFLLASAIGLLLVEQARGKAVRCIGEKTPGHIRTMPLLGALFPQAKFLHIIRDGRDVAVSGWLHNLRTAEADTREKFHDFAGYVRHVTPIWVRQIGMARAFASTCPDRYLEFRYEDLHQEQDATIERILNFLGVDSSSAMVARCREAGAFENLSKGRKRGVEDRNSHFRKGVVGDWKEHFDPTCTEIFMHHAGASLRELGYE